MKMNVKENIKLVTAEGGNANKCTNYQSLRRSVLSSMLWENGFYENGVKIADRISQLIPLVKPELVANLAIEARSKFNLRHMPLFICAEMVKHNTHKPFVSNVLSNIVQRPDELAEMLSIYWRNGRTPIANQIKKGLAKAFTKFDEYSLQKYNRDTPIKLKDVLFLTHAKPLNKQQDVLWKKLINNQLATPSTWEVEISASKNPKETWEKLLNENKLGGLALLRNLANFKKNEVNRDLIVKALSKMDGSRVLPFRYLAATKFYPQLEGEIEKAMFKSLNNAPKLMGKTLLLVDVSGSMDMHKISGDSELSRMDAACALAILLREQTESLDIVSFSKTVVEIPSRRGFALKDAIINSQPHKDTIIGPAIAIANKGNYDRIIILTDGQIQDSLGKVNCDKKYMLNVANNQNGIGYKDNWVNIDGFSQAVVDYLLCVDSEQ